MADVEEVADTLVHTIAALMRNGDGTPKNGVQTSIFAGWPLANDLKAALAAGQVMISVFTRAGAASNTTRHEARWKEMSPSVITTHAALNGNIVTFSGSITLPLNVGIQVGGEQVAYAAHNGDTLNDIAAEVAAALVLQGITATAFGPALTIDTNDSISVRLGSRAVFGREAYRTKQAFQITVWAPSQALRKATTKAFEGGLFAQTSLPLSDGSTGMFCFESAIVSDHSEVEGLYRRDVLATVEFSIFETDDAFDVVVAEQVTQVVATLEQ